MSERTLFRFWLWIEEIKFFIIIPNILLELMFFDPRTNIHKNLKIGK